MRERTTTDSSFPYWVALGSLIFVLALFFTNTVPALEEQKSLTALHHDLLELRQEYNDAIYAAAQLAQLGKGPDRNFDLQSLLVAIDRHGYTPLELDAIYRQMASLPVEDLSSGGDAPLPDRVVPEGPVLEGREREGRVPEGRVPEGRDPEGREPR